MDLIDVTPENQKEILECAKRYKIFQKRRIDALVDEKAEKQALLDLIKQAKVEPVEGKIILNVGGFTITVTPRDELIKVKNNSEEDDEE